jgi:transcriptional regulator with XRE-family HTH domain
MRTKEEIRETRKEAELTQREAAKLVGVSRAQWEHYEAGRRNMRERTFVLFQERIEERAKIDRLLGRLLELEAWKIRVDRAMSGGPWDD